jgi:MFS transporter, DHA2 family, multidrug resistance protein
VREAAQTPFVFVICLFTTLFLAVFYNTVTNMAGIYIVSDLGGSSDISVYSMVFFGLGNVLSIPLANPLADRFGAIKLLIYSLFLYTFFSILCGISSTFFVFNLFRFGLGLASGPFYILTRRLLHALAPKEILSVCSFIMTLMYVVVPVLGVTFGAWLAYENLWRWIFHLNEPIALFLALYFWCFFKQTDQEKTSSLVLDKTGYVFFVLGIGALVTAATLSQQLDWYRSDIFVALCIIGVPSLIFFVLWEISSRKPLLELRLLESPILSFALLNLAVLFSSYFGMIILITLWLKIYANYTPWWISVLVGTMAFAGVVACFVSNKLLRHFDPRVTLALAILCFASSCYYSTFFDVDIDFFHLAVARFLAGLGLVLFVLPLSHLAFSAFGREKTAAIFSLFQIVRCLFSSLGAGLYVVLWQRRRVFFHERLSESLTVNSQLFIDYFQRATEIFHLTKPQALEQSDILLTKQATSLALNDVFGCMGYILLGLLAILVLSFFIKFKRSFAENNS